MRHEAVAGAILGVLVLGTGCAGLQARAGSASFNAGIPVTVSGAVTPAAGTGEAEVVDVETGETLVAFGVRVNTPAVVSAGIRAIRRMVPELIAMVLGRSAPSPAPVGEDI